MLFELSKNDLTDAKRVVKSDKFAKFLLSNTTSFNAAGFILQTLLDKIEESEKEFEE